MALVLVADDDAHIRDVVSCALERGGHDCVDAGDGVEALRIARDKRPDLVVLDVGMPGHDGLEVCRTLRADPALAATPVLFLSARDEEIDRVLGLEMGGDDYVAKPFSPRELTARVNAILRRGQRAPEPDAEPLSHGAVRLDPERAEVTCAGEPVALTANEMSILRVLLERPGVVRDRAAIVAMAYSGIHVSDRTVDSHIRNVRAKFAVAGCTDVIETVHSLGFRLGPCTAPSSTAP